MVKRLLPVLFFGAILSAISTHAQEVGLEDSAKWNVTAECQMIVLPQKIALPMLADLLDETKIEGAFAKLQEMIANGTAQLAANLIAKAHDGQRAVAESIEEIKYGTDFDPPQLPQNAPNDPEILKHWPITGITPTGFETRNIGATLEVTVTTGESGKLLTVNAVPQHVRFLRWKKIDSISPTPRTSICPSATPMSPPSLAAFFPRRRHGRFSSAYGWGSNNPILTAVGG